MRALATLVMKEPHVKPTLSRAASFVVAPLVTEGLSVMRTSMNVP